MFFPFLHNASLIISFLFLLAMFKRYIIKNNINYFIFKVVAILINSCVSLLVMLDSFSYNGILFDLRGLPIFIISYMEGWRAGIAAAIIPVIYRLYLGGPRVIEGVVFDILIAVLIGSIFSEKNKKKPLITINIFRIIISYLIYITGNYLIPSLWVENISFLMLLSAAIQYSFFAIITLYCVVIIFNETTHNIMEHQQTREELLESRLQLEQNRLKTRFFGNLSHELKTPLNLIFSSLHLINIYKNKHLRLQDDEKLNKYLGIIKQNGFRLLRLVNNLMDITKMDTNSFHLNLKRCDIVAVVREITYSVEDYIESRDRILEFKTEFDNKFISLDPVNMERIMLNLLSNALKFTEQGDRITVSLYEQESNLYISVKDTGIGIEKDKHRQIFRLFHQIDDTMAKDREGSGIGLYIVKTLAELHGGNVQVKSQKGEGSEFIIELPVRELEEENIDSYQPGQLMDRVDIEFSDIYG